jgi:hypothetical protein
MRHAERQSANTLRSRAESLPSKVYQAKGTGTRDLLVGELLGLLIASINVDTSSEQRCDIVRNEQISVYLRCTVRASYSRR